MSGNEGGHHWAMLVRLVVHGDVDGNQWPYWKEIAEPFAVPRVGDVVDMGVATGANRALNARPVTSVRWSESLDFVEVTLADLHGGWLQANRTAFTEAGWHLAVAGAG